MEAGQFKTLDEAIEKYVNTCTNGKNNTNSVLYFANKRSYPRKFHNRFQYNDSNFQNRNFNHKNTGQYRNNNFHRNNNAYSRGRNRQNNQHRQTYNNDRNSNVRFAQSGNDDAPLDMGLGVNELFPEDN